MATTQIQLLNLINNHAVVVFSKSYCPYSKMAKSAIAENQHLFSKNPQLLCIIDIDLQFSADDMARLQQSLYKLTGKKTVPLVFMNGKYIGGGTDIDELQRNGKLEGMIKQAIAK